MDWIGLYVPCTVRVGCLGSDASRFIWRTTHMAPSASFLDSRSIRLLPADPVSDRPHPTIAGTQIHVFPWAVLQLQASPPIELLQPDPIVRVQW